MELPPTLSHFLKRSKRVILPVLFPVLFPVFLFSQLTRQEAVDIVLNPASGVVIESQAAVWSPFVDFGFGAGFEGMVSNGAIIEPAYLSAEPYTGSVLLTSSRSYFFWIDVFPFADYQHHTIFVLVDANNPAPSVANGGILLFDQGWWPVITSSGFNTQAFFDDDIKRASDDPPGYLNPDGLIAGSVQKKSDVVALPPLNPPPVQENVAATAATNPCALVINGSNQNTHINNAKRYINDLRNHYGVPANRIIQAKTDADGNPAAATAAEIDAAITNLCNLDPACDKIYVRITSHGSRNSLQLAGGSISGAELCQKIQKIAGKGVPVCMIINACFSGTLLDANNWNLPAGSSIITSAKDTTSYGGGDTYKEEGSGATFTESIFTYAFSQCLNSTADANRDGVKDADKNRDGIVDDCEAYDWVKARRPCYRYRGGASTTMVYPSGAQTWWDPDPQKRTVGRNPFGVNINVQNLTGADKTDFHLIFKGDVRGGLARAWRSNQNDQIGSRWADGDNETTITYDEQRDETMVCWIDAQDPVANGEFVHFGYSRAGGGLRPVRQYWTPTTEPPASTDRVPTANFSLNTSDFCSVLLVELSVRNELNGGWGADSFFDVFYRISPEEIPLENLNLSDPLVAELQRIPLGTFPLTPEQPVLIPIEIVELQLTSPPFLILEATGSWDLNENTAMILSQIPLPDPLPVDLDGDGVCDTEDVCPGGNDMLNADFDFFPDDCDCDPADPNDTDIVVGIPGEDIFPGEYRANVSIQSQGIVLLSSAVTFQAGQEIRLLPGFHAHQGSGFQGVISPCFPGVPTTPTPAPAETKYPILTQNVSTSSPKSTVPQAVTLAIQPNPFDQMAVIRYDLPEEGPVQLTIFSLATGQPVRQISRKVLGPGRYTETFSGEGLARGLYYVLLRTGEKTVGRKVMLF